jgi:hypothetical protein
MSKYDAEAIKAQAEEIVFFKTREKRAKYERHFGTFGKYILENGTGGGFTAIPHAVDTYEGALGMSRDETWFMKRLCRHLPNVFPTMTKIAKEANTSGATLSRIKSGLIKKGFIRDGGKHSNDALQRDLNIAPFFDALFLCILCDPESKTVKGQAMDKVRAEFTYEWYDVSREEMEYRVMAEDFCFTELPLPVDVAKKFAEPRRLILNWDYINEMQNGAALKKLENLKLDKMRMLEIKSAITDGADGNFSIVYGYKNAYEWLKWLCGLSVNRNDVERLTEQYCKQAETPNAKEYMQWMRTILDTPHARKILAEHEVLSAVRESQVYSE